MSYRLSSYALFSVGYPGYLRFRGVTTAVELFDGTLDVSSGVSGREIYSGKGLKSISIFSSLDSYTFYLSLI